MRDRWEREQVEDEETWKELIRRKIHTREEMKWRLEVEERSKLRTYRKIKKDLEKEKYLEVENTFEITKLRGGTNRLRIEKGRYENLPASERFCEICRNGEVEDERHFLLSCSEYDDLRREMWNEVEDLYGMPRPDSEDDQLNWILGTQFVKTSKYKNLVKIVIKFVKKSMNRRKLRKVSCPERWMQCTFPHFP